MTRQNGAKQVGSELHSRFDWYEVTLDSFEDGRIAPSLAVILGGELRQGRGLYGYQECWQIVRGEDELVKVYGRSVRIGEVHVVVSGVSCDEVVPVIRRLWPEHRVSRVDASVDLEVAFATVDRKALEFAKDRRLKHRLTTNSDGGATRYLGAPSSEMVVRVYKKSEQLKALHPDRADEIPEGIVRFEAQFRPGKREIKEAVATMPPDHVWGLSRWGQEFAAALLDIDAPRVSTHFRRPSDYSRALFYLGKQYGPLMQRRVDEIGRQEAVNEVLEALQL